MPDNTTEKRIIFLHIGQPKTGTSSIQKYCESNSHLLAKQGLIYELMPFVYNRTGQRRNAHFLATGVPDDQNSKKAEKRRKIKDAQIKQGLAIVEEQLTRGNVLLTDERLWNYLAPYDYDALHIMLDFAAEHNAVLKVIVYLRAQDAWIASLYHQNIRAGRVTTRWNDYINNVPDTTQLNYDKACRELAELVGRENLIVRVYDRAQFPDGRVESDFMKALGIEITDEFVTPKEETNASLTNNYAEMTRIMNPLIQQKGVTEADGRIFEFSAVYCSKKFGEQKKTNLLTPEQKKMLEEKYGESNRILNEEFLNGMELSFKPQKDLPVWEPDNETRYEETMLFLGRILLQQQQRISELEKLIYDRTGFKGFLRSIKRGIKNLFKKDSK